MLACAATARAEAPTTSAPVVALAASPDLSPAVSAAMDAAAHQAAAAQLDPFVKNKRYWSLTTGASRDTSLGVVALAQLAVNRYVARNLALVYGVILGYANTNRTPASVLGGPEVGLRWHWLRGERWSTYLEGLVGAVLQTHPLTEESLRFNFDLEPGTGASYLLNENTLVQGGVRWHHLSNARVRGADHNFGYDGPLAYVELLKAF